MDDVVEKSHEKRNRAGVVASLRDQGVTIRDKGASKRGTRESMRLEAEGR